MKTKLRLFIDLLIGDTELCSVQNPIVACKLSRTSLKGANLVISRMREVNFGILADRKTRKEFRPCTLRHSACGPRSADEQPWEQPS